VLFELISARYERRSLLITANQPFGEWGKIFPDQAMTVAVVDRLALHMVPGSVANDALLRRHIEVAQEFVELFTRLMLIEEPITGKPN
jgi:IstB-like ATP binding protein